MTYGSISELPLNRIVNDTAVMKEEEKLKKVSINEPPEVVDKQARIGDWEGDTIIRKDKKVYY